MILILVLVAICISTFALINTQIMIRDLSEIKARLGIKEEKKTAFLKRDLDHDE